MPQPNTLFSYFKKTPSKVSTTPKPASPCTPLQNKNHVGSKTTPHSATKTTNLNNFSSPNLKSDSDAVGKENDSSKIKAGLKKEKSSDLASAKKRRRIIDSESEDEDDVDADVDDIDGDQDFKLPDSLSSESEDELEKEAEDESKLSDDVDKSEDEEEMATPVKTGIKRKRNGSSITNTPKTPSFLGTPKTPRTPIVSMSTISK